MIDNANLSTSLNRGVLVARVKCQKVGDFEAAPLRGDIEKFASTADWKVVIDMTQVLLLGSQGIGMLVTVKKSCDANKGKMVICGLSDELMGVMKVAALTKLFVIKKDLAAAMGEF